MPTDQNDHSPQRGHPGSADLPRAMQIASHAHSGQTDKTGEPYFSHCRRMADALKGDETKTVAYLHDVVEKGDGWDLNQLEAEGFGPEIVEAVDALTRRPDETDEEFVRRAASNDIARPVKIADLRDNLDQARTIGAETSKYEQGLRIIEVMQAGPNIEAE